MSKRTRVSIDDTDVNGAFASWLFQMIFLIAPKHLRIIAGRATAKTSEIIAQRSQDVMYDMPKSYQVLVSDTYINALKNIVPTLLEGWKRRGWREGMHYVTDKRPPSHFRLPYKPVESYKHTISIFNGCFMNLGSLDQPGGLAGGSYQHMYADEARLLKFDKLKKLMPAIRGEYTIFGHSVYYRGSTFTTDMPNIIDGDDDWILNDEKNMNMDQVRLALEVGLVVNEIKKQILACKQIGDYNSIEKLKSNLGRWTEKWIRVRKDLTFFYVVSSLVNVDILTEGYFSDSLKALGIEEFKSAILSLKVNLKKGEKFYGNLGEHHFYEDGIINSFYDKYTLTDEIEETCLALRYLDRKQKLEAGADFGDMCSLIPAQTRGNYLYILKEFCTLAPENEIQLGKKFVNFFKHHEYKVLDLYYDRSGNQNQKTKRDWATALKNAIEFQDGVSTGWVVNLMSLNQSTIYQEEEYNFAKALMGETSPNLVKLKIDKFQCKCLKSSLELTKIKIKTSISGSKTIHKDKSSESLALHLRPMFSTNYSDAFKYLIYRRDFVDRVNTSGLYTSSDPGFY
ncbi:MAG: hypothetical protein BGO88_04875 [Flavobacterium sp. 38-13]|uniref:hypothetical protein n=1 Tax=Flavobacterium sp. 38-13 TaxID=1896168 RepID=UPI000962D6E6|nr:hypothetical protein [Flavobacterium sp. 38-13]OJX55551.1 MAG: hypothetical protein BGO88_04875 [Flavobacterium sp. 38-13]